MAPRRRARIDAEIDHRGVTELVFTVPKYRGARDSNHLSLTCSSDTFKHGREPRKVGCDEETILHGHWLFISVDA